MKERLLALIDDVEDARADLVVSLERLGESLRQRALLERPETRLSEMDPLPGTELHERLIDGLERMHHAIAAARAESVRVMVDDEGLTLSDVAKLMNRPRQLVSRLYRSASQTASAG
jgi:EAL domain-containing protein (putative c-di-GMP-specific phosphodiesterase class I)